MCAESVVFNGVNAATGGYLYPASSTAELSKVALGEPLDPVQLRELQWRQERRRYPTLGPIEEVDPTKLDQAGWGVVFADGADPAVREALGPLLDHRRAQAGGRYREFRGPDGYRPGESKSQFLARHKQGPGPVDPDCVPYYLLLVGDPEHIPYRFQYLLDVQFAVGRIAFDTPVDYAAYADSVVRTETQASAPARRAVFFGVRNTADGPTQMSADQLVIPLAGKIGGIAEQSALDWTVETVVGDDAKRARLQQLLGGTQTPSLLFSASHGVGFPQGHPLQRSTQGALLCQDWPGPLLHRGPIPPDFYLAGDNIAAGADLTGLIAFFFACFSGGTPTDSDFPDQPVASRVPLSLTAFVARLPQRMLSQPDGGALAVVAHVDRTLGYSFVWPGAGPQLGVFESTLERLLKGAPLGHAVEFFNTKYAELSAEMSSELEDVKFGATPDEVSLAGLWTALNDSRTYVIIGDPAVRFAVR